MLVYRVAWPPGPTLGFPSSLIDSCESTSKMSNEIKSQYDSQHVDMLEDEKHGVADHEAPVVPRGNGETVKTGATAKEVANVGRSAELT